MCIVHFFIHKKEVFLCKYSLNNLNIKETDTVIRY